MGEIKLEGVDAILAKLQKIGANVSKLENKALRNAAEPVLSDAKSTSVFSDNTGNLREGLKMSSVKIQDGAKYITVGIDKSDNSKIFYGKFIEFGTSKMSARPFLGPAYEKNKNEIENIISSTLKEGLK